MDELLQRRYLDSCYEELTTVQNKDHVTLVKHKETGEIRIRKVLTRYDRSLYDRLMKLSISGIPQIYEYMDTGTELIVLEEYINGKTLDALLREKGIMSEEEVYPVFEQVTDILHRIHSLEPPVIHRDIKPSNIMMTSAGTLYLIDFNAAREYDTASVGDTRLMGTQDFAAPEQYGFGQSDVKTDQYGLGVTLNVLLTGDFPKYHLTDSPVFRSVILRLTQIDPAQRYEQIDEAVHQLKDRRKAAGSKPGILVLGISERFRKIVDSRQRISYPEHPYDGTWRRFLPVGFRTGRLWRMVLAGVWYWALADHYFFSESDGYPAAHFLSFVLYLLNTFYIGNYLGIRYRLPGVRINWWLHILLNIFYLVLFDLILGVLLALLLVFFLR